MAQDPWAVVSQKPVTATPAPHSDPWAVVEVAPASQTEPSSDLTANPNGEGLYRMGSYDFSGGNVSKPEIQVPYSKVEAAQESGYKLHPDEEPRYQKDKTHEGQNPTLWERAKSTFQSSTEPIPDNSVRPIDPKHPIVSTLNRAGDAMENVYKVPWNVLVSTERGLAGLATLPAQAASTVKKIYEGDPQGIEDLENISPPGIAENLTKAYRDDVERVGPVAAISNLTGSLASMYVAGKLVTRASEAIPIIAKKIPSAAKAKYAPRTVKLAGEEVPVLVGEAEPESSAGRSQVSLKRSGTGSKQFENVQQEQYAKIKNVIRNTAQQTSGLVAPMQEEPGAAMADAATATFEAAKPMYKALDEELVTVPGDLHAASVIVKKAIARAKNYGYDFAAASEDHYGEEPLGLGEKLSESNQPLTTFMKIRSELGKMRAASSDGAFRHNITEEMKSMTNAMDNALNNTGLKDMWKEADRLWAKGYALREIADTLNSTTKGTPPVEQAGELSRVPTEMQGARLVEKLNELRRDGTLTRGFTPEEASNLRKAADILDRIQTTPVGRGFGESVSQGRAIAHLLRGNAGPMIGAGLGFALIHTPVGAESGAALGFIVQRIGERALVNIMTKTEGLKMLRTLSTAKTPTQIGRAVNSIITYAGASSAVKDKSKPHDESDTTQPEQQTVAQ